MALAGWVLLAWRVASLAKSEKADDVHCDTSLESEVQHTGEIRRSFAAEATLPRAALRREGDEEPGERPAKPAVRSSLAEASAQAPVLGGLRALRSCGFCVFLATLVTLFWRWLTKTCNKYMPDGYAAFGQHGDFEPFRCLVCLHQLNNCDPEAEFSAWVLSRPAGRGGQKPPESSLDETRLEAGVPLAVHSSTNNAWPVVVEVLIPPRRPELQVALYTKPGSFAKPKYFGCATIDVGDLLAGSERPILERALPLRSEKKRDKGELVVSLYREGRAAQSFAAWSEDRIPLATLFALDQAVERLDPRGKNGVRTEVPEKCRALAELLSGNFLLANRAGTSVPRYFAMVQKRKKWFWVWHHQTHVTYPARPVESGNRRKGFLPVRTIISAFVLKDDPTGFLVRYRAEDKSVKELVLSGTGCGAGADFGDVVRGRDTLLWALRAMRDEVTAGEGDASDASVASVDSGVSGVAEDSSARSTLRPPQQRRRSRSPAGEPVKRTTLEPPAAARAASADRQRSGRESGRRRESSGSARSGSARSARSHSRSSR